LKIGVTICVIAGLVSAIFSGVFGMIFPEYFEEVFDKVGKMMVEKNPDMPSAQIEMSISMMKKFSNPAISIPITVLMFAFIGLIWSLIVGAIVKKDRNQSI
jgi:energy-converting hydrogenase Eha subunit A